MDIGDLPVIEVMDREVNLIDGDRPIDEALRHCSEHESADVIVVDQEERYLGLITHIEILGYISPFMGIHTGRKTMGPSLMVHRCPRTRDLMNPGHRTVGKDTPLSEALLHMRKDHHRYLVVLDEEGRVLGKVNLCDIITLLLKEGFLQGDTCELNPGGP